MKVEELIMHLENYNKQSAARAQNAFCVSNEYPIYPVPVAFSRNGVNAGEIPPGFPKTRGDLMAMSRLSLRELALCYQQVVPDRESKANLLKLLGLMFGILM